MKKHYVIFIPGLGSNIKKLEFATKFWKKYNIQPIVYPINWHNKQKTFSQYLKELTLFIKHLNNKGHIISVVGCSAGGSLAVNSLFQNNQINKVVNVCGRLKKGSEKGFRSFKNKTRNSLIFAESVISSEKNLKIITPELRKKIMTIHPLFGDELVPKETTTIKNGYNISLPLGEHVITISLALTIFAKKIVNFLKR